MEQQIGERVKQTFADVYFMAGSAFNDSKQYIVWSGRNQKCPWNQKTALKIVM